MNTSNESQITQKIEEYRRELAPDIPAELVKEIVSCAVSKANDQVGLIGELDRIVAQYMTEMNQDD